MSLFFDILRVRQKIKRNQTHLNVLILLPFIKLIQFMIQVVMTERLDEFFHFEKSFLITNVSQMQLCLRSIGAFTELTPFQTHFRQFCQQKMKTSSFMIELHVCIR